MTRPRILMVEDNAGDVLLLQEALRATAWDPEVIHLGDGLAALDTLFRRKEHVRSPRPDLLVLDMNLPGLSGHELLNALRADPDLSSMPVVVFSGSAWDRERAEAAGLPGGHYLVKPDSFSGFLEIAARLEKIWRDG